MDSQLIGIIVVDIFFGFMVISGIINTNRIKKFGVLTKAKVIDRWERRRGGRLSVKYLFVALNGQKYERITSISPKGYKNAQIGGDIEIVYLMNKPNINMLSEFRDFKNNTVGICFLAVLGLINVWFFGGEI